MLQKNLNADLTNPNAYHIIGDANEEHVYDEIKQKDDSKDPGKGDFQFNLLVYNFFLLKLLIFEMAVNNITRKT